MRRCKKKIMSENNVGCSHTNRHLGSPRSSNDTNVIENRLITDRFKLKTSKVYHTLVSQISVHVRLI